MLCHQRFLFQSVKRCVWIVWTFCFNAAKYWWTQALAFSLSGPSTPYPKLREVSIKWLALGAVWLCWLSYSESSWIRPRSGPLSDLIDSKCGFLYVVVCCSISFCRCIGFRSGKKYDIRNTTKRNTTKRNNAKTNTTKKNTTNRNTTNRDTTKRNTTKKNTTKRNTTKRNTTKRNATKRNETNTNTTKRNTTKRNTTKRNTTKRNTTRHKQRENYEKMWKGQKTSRQRPKKHKEKHVKVLSWVN